MTHEELKSRLCEKMRTEFEAYREHLLSESPQEILGHAYEYAIRDDIMETLDVTELTDTQMEKLLNAEYSLADVVRAYKYRETEYMDAIRDSIGEAANTIMKDV